MKKTPTRAPGKDVRAPVLALIKHGQAYTSIGIAACINASRKSVWNSLLRMCKAGQIAMLKFGPDVLYFKSSADAEAFSVFEREEFCALRLEQRRAILASMSKKGHEARAKLAVKRYAVVPAKEARPAPVTITCTRQAWADRPVDMSRAVVTVAATPKPRFGADEGHRGAFSLAGIGRDVQSGRAWE